MADHNAVGPRNKNHPSTSMLRVEPQVKSLPGKRKHSESDKYSPASYGESESQESHSQSSRSRRRNESPAVGGDEVPSTTSAWIAERICSRLQIECREVRDPYSIFFREYIALKKDSPFCNLYLERFPANLASSEHEGEVDSYGIKQEQKEFIEHCLETIDRSFKLNLECFEYVLNTWDALDCEYINQINVSHALKIVQDLDHFQGLAISSCEWLKRKSIEKKIIVQEICNHICSRLKLFYDQLLFMMNRSLRDTPLTERMFQDLFQAFVRIFNLKIYDITETEHNFLIGEREVISEPDAMICKFTDSESSAVSTLESSAFVVVEVKKYRAKEQRETTHDLTSTSTTTQPVAAHVNSNLKGHHIGDMLAVTQSSSAFGKNGVLGFIVQGTKVTLASLQVSEDFFSNANMTGNVKRAGGVVKYSKECNILLKRGRRELIPIFLSMATLFKND